MALKYDIQNENFDYFFLEQAAKMGETQKETLPKELQYKIYRKGYRVQAKGLYAISFFEKLFILTVALNKKWVFVIEDSLNEMRIEDFFKYKGLTKDSESAANELKQDGIFVLGANEFIETYDSLNNYSVKSAYNYLMKTKTKNYLEPDDYKSGMVYLSKFINHYESQRKNILLQAGISMAEWITLTFLYDGEEKVCSILYKEKFRFSFNSSSTKIKLSFSTLQHKGLIAKSGQRATSKFKITALGKQKVSSIMSKYVVNCN